MPDNFHAVASFENARWSQGKQKIEYRHTAACSLLPQDVTSLLDVGCGDGTFLSLITGAEKKIKLTGIDFSSVGLSIAREKVPYGYFAQVDANSTYPFPDGAFDVVVALDVLEHTLEPEKMLKEMRRVSKQFVLLSVPNFNSLPARLQMLIGRVPENNKSNKGHMYWFNFTTLHLLLEQVGFSVVKEVGSYQQSRTPLIGTLIRVMRDLNPKLFSLSFVILAQKKSVQK